MMLKEIRRVVAEARAALVERKREAGVACLAAVEADDMSLADAAVSAMDAAEEHLRHAEMAQRELKRRTGHASKTWPVLNQ
jgi:hypothetical protein